MKGTSMKKLRENRNHTDVGTRSRRLSVNPLAIPSLVVKRAKTLELERWWWRGHRV